MDWQDTIDFHLPGVKVNEQNYLTDILDQIVLPWSESDFKGYLWTFHKIPCLPTVLRWFSNSAAPSFLTTFAHKSGFVVLLTYFHSTFLCWLCLRAGPVLLPTKIQIACSVSFRKCGMKRSIPPFHSGCILKASEGLHQGKRKSFFEH